jgi:hypothetical protein
MQQTKKRVLGSSAWSTNDELVFLEGLSTDNPKAFQQYKVTFGSRKHWGNIDKSAIARFLELKGEDNGQSKAKV